MEVSNRKSYELITYPFRMLSSCLLPVEIRMHFLRFSRSSEAVTKPLAEGYIKLEDNSPPSRSVTYGKLLGSISNFFDFDLGEAFDSQESP